jgi:hypothetical protein
MLFAFICVQCLRQKSAQTAQPLLCSLMFDEMSIRKHIRWNGKENEGFIDLGTKLDDDSVPVAGEVLLFIVVPLSATWKLPVAYFLIDGMTADVKASLITEAIIRLHHVNVRVAAVVCDGPATNFAVSSILGAKIDVQSMKSHFVHPVVESWNVYMLFDAAHMLKLLRNTLADKHILTAGKSGKQIRWQHITDLFQLQDTEGLKAANKLRRGHIEWFSQKMKVSLAVQTLSRSVASSLEFVADDLKLPKFADVAETVKFIRIVDRLFDTLNSKNPFAREFKSVLRMRNEKFWRPFLLEASEYLRSLHLNGVPLHQTVRKTAVLGFLTTISSVIGLFDEFVPCGKLQYLATYRLSQDHIELVFNVVRSRGRWNNNPTAGQFRSAYRHLLMKNNVQPNTTGNVTSQEDFQLLPVAAEPIVNAEISAVSSESILDRCQRDSDKTSIAVSDHTYAVTPERIELSEFSANIVTYVAGRVAGKLCKKLKCGACKTLLISTSKIVQSSKLITRKDVGGLIYPSNDVVRVCCEAERHIRFVNGCAAPLLPSTKNLQLRLQIGVINSIEHLHLFTDAVDDNDHSCITDVFESHVLNLVRLIVNMYVNMRLYVAGKTFTDKLRGKNVRVSSNKQVLFMHQ